MDETDEKERESKRTDGGKRDKKYANLNRQKDWMSKRGKMKSNTQMSRRTNNEGTNQKGRKRANEKAVQNVRQRRERKKE